MNRILKYFVTASVLLNILLLGLTAGHIVHRFNHRAMPPSMEKLLDTLPQARQEEFLHIIEQSRNEKKARWRDIRIVRETIANILIAEPFDAEAYQAQVDKLQLLQGQQWQQMANGIKMLALRWPPEERVVLAEMMRRPPPHKSSKPLP